MNPKSKPVEFELGKIEPAVRKPEFEELMGAGGTRRDIMKC